MGKSALEGFEGVKRVEKGWKDFKEINRVVYDRKAISIEEMEAALKNAGAYRGTAK